VRLPQELGAAKVCWHKMCRSLTFLGTKLISAYPKQTYLWMLAAVWSWHQGYEFKYVHVLLIS
jgi:hypothetical protein